MDHKTFDIRNICQKRKYFQMIDKLVRFFYSSLNLKCKNRTSAIFEKLLV